MFLYLATLLRKYLCTLKALLCVKYIAGHVYFTAQNDLENQSQLSHVHNIVLWLVNISTWQHL